MNIAYITVPKEPIAFHNYLRANGLKLLKGITKFGKNSDFERPQQGDALQHTRTNVRVKIRSIRYDDRHQEKYLTVTNFNLEPELFQELFYDYKK